MRAACLHAARSRSVMSREGRTVELLSSLEYGSGDASREKLFALDLPRCAEAAAAGSLIRGGEINDST